MPGGTPWSTPSAARGRRGRRRRHVGGRSTARPRRARRRRSSRCDRRSCGTTPSRRPRPRASSTDSAPRPGRTAVGRCRWPSFTITKLAWLVANEPRRSIGSIDRVMLPHDYLTFRLHGRSGHRSGRCVGERLVRSATRASTGRISSRWSVVATTGPHPCRRCSAPTEPPGRVTGDGCRRSGFAGRRSPSVREPATTWRAALGLGLRPGDAGDVARHLRERSMPSRRRRRTIASGAVAGFCDATGGYLPLVCTLNATKVTDTVGRMARASIVTSSSALALAAPAGPNGVSLIPYFDGERTPNLPDATGTFEGSATPPTAPTSPARPTRVSCAVSSHGVEALRRGRRIDRRHAST